MVKTNNEKAKVADKTMFEEILLAAISYVSILFLIAWLKRDSKFVQFHVKQGMLLFIGTVLINFAASATPIFGLFLIMPVGNLIVVALAVTGVIQAIRGKYWKMPYGIGDLAEKIKLF